MLPTEEVGVVLARYPPERSTQQLENGIVVNCCRSTDRHRTDASIGHLATLLDCCSRPGRRSSELRRTSSPLARDLRAVTHAWVHVSEHAIRIGRPHPCVQHPQIDVGIEVQWNVHHLT